MQQNYYDFLFNLRASGFIHNSAENIRQMFYQREPQLPESYTINPVGEVSHQRLDGEIGSFSETKLPRLRYTFVVIATSTALLSMEAKLNREKSASLGDYFINRVDEINSAEDFNRMVREMLDAFHEAEMQDARPGYGQPVDACIDYVNQNLYSKLTVEQTAESLGYSPSYLSELFRRTTGESLYAYIQAQKLKEAAAMLRYTRQKLTAIASALGYHSLSHFSKAFKAAYGVTPSSYRKDGPA